MEINVCMGCQLDIAEKILGKNADYQLAVKDNQKDLYHEVRNQLGMDIPSTGHASKRDATTKGSLKIKKSGLPTIRTSGKEY